MQSQKHGNVVEKRMLRPLPENRVMPFPRSGELPALRRGDYVDHGGCYSFWKKEELNLWEGDLMNWNIGRTRKLVKSCDHSSFEFWKARYQRSRNLEDYNCCKTKLRKLYYCRQYVQTHGLYETDECETLEALAELRRQIIFKLVSLKNLIGQFRRHLGAALSYSSRITSIHYHPMTITTTTITIINTTRRTGMMRMVGDGVRTNPLKTNKE